MFWPPVGSATRSNSCCALPDQRAPQGTHERRHRRRCTLPVPLIPATPQPSPGGSADRVPLLGVSGCAVPAPGPLRSFLPSCKRLYCNAAGLLRQGLASWCAPAGQPLWAGCQRGREAVSGEPQCWRTAVVSPARVGDRRRTRIPDAALARAGGQRGGSVPPHPSPVAVLRGCMNGLLLAGLCAAGHRGRGRAPVP
jgi:hypothetical protein